MENGTQFIKVGIAVANASRAQWIELLLSSIPDLQVWVWTGKPDQPDPFDALVVDVDQPGSTFLGWYQRTVKSHTVPHLLVFGDPLSPLMMNIEWDEERTSFIPKPYQLESLRDVLITKCGHWVSSKKDPGSVAPLRQPLGYLSSLAIADLIQMLCLSRWSGRIIATELDSRRVGQAYVSGGVLIHAETPTAQGAEACIDLVNWGKCDFYFEEQHPPVVATITQTWQELLLEGARRMDESGPHAAQA